jgi:hypothetical protein
LLDSINRDLILVERSLTSLNMILDTTMELLILSSLFSVS